MILTKCFFSRTTGPISPKFSTMHPWVKGIQIQVCSNEGLRPFPRGDNYNIAKIHSLNFQILYITTGPISTKLGEKQSWLEEDLSLFKCKAHTFLHWEIILKKMQKYIHEHKNLFINFGANFIYI